MKESEVERFVSAWLADEALGQAPDRILSEVRMRVAGSARQSTRVARFAVVTAAAAAILVGTVIVGGFLRQPTGPAASSAASPSPAPSGAALVTPSPAQDATPSPGPSPTIDTTGRETTVIVGGGIEAGLHFLAGDYLVTEDVRAAGQLCSTVVVAVDQSWNGDYRAYRAADGPHVQFVGFTLDSYGSGHTALLKTFPRGMWQFVAGPYDPLGPPGGDGSAALCQDWTFTLEAR